MGSIISIFRFSFMDLVFLVLVYVIWVVISLFSGF